MWRSNILYTQLHTYFFFTSTTYIYILKKEGSLIVLRQVLRGPFHIEKNNSGLSSQELRLYLLGFNGWTMNMLFSLQNCDRRILYTTFNIQDVKNLPWIERLIELSTMSRVLLHASPRSMCSSVHWAVFYICTSVASLLLPPSATFVSKGTVSRDGLEFLFFTCVDRFSSGKAFQLNFIFFQCSSYFWQKKSRLFCW
jgi:hypothetical protein